MKSYRVNALIQAMCRSPETIGRMSSDLEGVFDEFGLTEAERNAFRDGSMEAMSEVGAHPILQMHWLMARIPEITQQMSIVEYPNLLEE